MMRRGWPADRSGIFHHGQLAETEALGESGLRVIEP
jgi:hypothetical protein